MSEQLTKDQQELAVWLAEQHVSGKIPDEFTIRWEMKDWQPITGQIVEIQTAQPAIRFGSLVALEDAGLIKTVSSDVVAAQKPGTTKGGTYQYGWPRHERARTYTTLGSLLSFADRALMGELEPSDQAPSKGSSRRGKYFISEDKIQQLREARSDDFDLSRLIRYCEEINDNYRRGNYSSVAFLSRAVLDHIPPIFGQANFNAVAAQAKGRSLKKVASRLDNSLRRIADHHLHKQISGKESLPSAEEIDYSGDLNFLIGRVLETL